MTSILIGTSALTAIAFVFSILLALSIYKFSVPTDPKLDDIRSALPGANCGACGYAGCDALADALSQGKAPVDACPVGGREVANEVATILGLAQVEPQVCKVATLLCQGTIDNCKTKFSYHGIVDCVAATLVNDGNRACQYACLGMGTCVRACKFGAISIDEHSQIAMIDIEKCTSCGSCVKVCPKNVLSMQPAKRPVRLLCSAAQRGKVVSDNCKVGCIGCGLCRKACKFDAIVMENHLPLIDIEKCTGCMMCAEVCPTSAIWADYDNRHIALIDRELCQTCGTCKQTCQFEAISGAVDTVFEVNESCTGCGECVPKCPHQAIKFPIRDHVRDANAKVGTTETVSAIPNS